MPGVKHIEQREVLFQIARSQGLNARAEFCVPSRAEMLDPVAGDGEGDLDGSVVEILL